MRPVHPKLLALMMVLLCACGGSAIAPALPQPEPFRPEVRPAPTVDELVAGLSVRDRIAQLVVPWIPGTYAAYDAEAFASPSTTTIGWRIGTGWSGCSPPC